MKVVVVHNRYQSATPSGENQAVDAEIALLASAGVKVVPFFEDSDSLIDAGIGQRAVAAAGPVLARAAVRRFAAVLHHERPDVVHVHNVFPLISPWVIRLAAQARIPVVQTVHNYRRSCVNGLHVRQGRRCDDCLTKSVPWPAVAHGCYRDSRLQSLPMVASQVVHRGTWAQVDLYIALTPFMRDRLICAGVPAARIAVRPSYVADRPWAPSKSADLAFVGRLDEAKGVLPLLAAWRARGDGVHAPSGRLYVAGDGPLQAAVVSAAATDPSIQYLGRLTPDRVQHLMSQVGGLVIPSIFYEGFPLTLAEAFASGRAAVVSEGGSAASIVTDETGWTTTVQPQALSATLNSITAVDLRARGRAARRYYERHLTPSGALAHLLQLYSGLLTPE